MQNNPNQQQPVPQEQLREQTYKVIHDALRLLAVGFGERRAELLKRLDALIEEVYYAQR